MEAEHKKQLKEIIRYYGVARFIKGASEVINETAEQYPHGAIIHTHAPMVQKLADQLNVFTLNHLSKAMNQKC